MDSYGIGNSVNKLLHGMLSFFKIFCMEQTGFQFTDFIIKSLLKNNKCLLVIPNYAENVYLTCL